MFDPISLAAAAVVFPRMIFADGDSAPTTNLSIRIRPSKPPAGYTTFSDGGYIRTTCHFMRLHDWSWDAVEDFLQDELLRLLSHERFPSIIIIS